MFIFSRIDIYKQMSIHFTFYLQLIYHFLVIYPTFIARAQKAPYCNINKKLQYHLNDTKIILEPKNALQKQVLKAMVEGNNFS